MEYLNRLLRCFVLFSRSFHVRRVFYSCIFQSHSLSNVRPLLSVLEYLKAATSHGKFDRYILNYKLAFGRTQEFYGRGRD